MKHSVSFFSYINKHGDSRCKYGVICNGEILLKPIYNYAIGFENYIDYWGDMTDIAIVRIGRKWGVINSSLEEVLPIAFDEIDEYSVAKGFFRVYQNGKHGLYDLAGELILPLEYDECMNYRGLTRVRKGEGYSFLALKDGNVQPIKGDELTSHPDYRFFEEREETPDLVHVESLQRYDKVLGEPDDKVRIVRVGRKYGCVNQQGEEIIPVQYQKIELLDFDERIIVKQKNRYGYSNFQGEQLTPITYDGAWNFYEDRAIVMRYDDASVYGRCGFINLVGEEVIPLKYNSVGDFYNGRARVRNGMHWGFVDVNGVEVIAPTYDYLQNFISDTTVYGSAGKYGLINYDGVEVTPPIYDKITYFSDSRYLQVGSGRICSSGNEYVVVELNGKLGVANKEGEELTPIIYDSIQSSIKEMLQVKIGNKWGVIDRNGKEFVATKYSDLCLDYRYIGAKYRGKWAILNWEGERVTPFVFEALNSTCGCIDGKWYLVNESGTICDKLVGSSIWGGDICLENELDWKTIK